jgi:hypothetical protein
VELIILIVVAFFLFRYFAVQPTRMVPPELPDKFDDGLKELQSVPLVAEADDAKVLISSAPQIHPKPFSELEKKEGAKAQAPAPNRSSSKKPRRPTLHLPPVGGRVRDCHRKASGNERVVVIDFETTGFNPDQGAKIIEI